MRVAQGHRTALDPGVPAAVTSTEAYCPAERSRYAAADATNALLNTPVRTEDQDQSALRGMEAHVRMTVCVSSLRAPVCGCACVQTEALTPGQHPTCDLPGPTSDNHKGLTVSCRGGSPPPPTALEARPGPCRHQRKLQSWTKAPPGWQDLHS